MVHKNVEISADSCDHSSRWSWGCPAFKTWAEYLGETGEMLVFVIPS